MLHSDQVASVAETLKSSSKDVSILEIAQEVASSTSKATEAALRSLSKIQSSAFAPLHRYFESEFSRKYVTYVHPVDECNNVSMTAAFRMLIFVLGIFGLILRKPFWLLSRTISVPSPIAALAYLPCQCFLSSPGLVFQTCDGHQFTKSTTGVDFEKKFVVDLSTLTAMVYSDGQVQGPGDLSDSDMLSVAQNKQNMSAAAEVMPVCMYWSSYRVDCSSKVRLLGRHRCIFLTLPNA